MNTVRWMIAIILVTFGLWLFFLNWYAFWVRYIRKKVDSPSWMPLVAGIALCGGLFAVPLQVRGYCLLPFLVDWGSLPGLVYTVYWHLRRPRRESA